MPEISQAELEVLQRSRALLDTIYADPDHGMQVKRAVAKVRPDLTIPELATEAAMQPFAAKVDEIGAAVAAMNARLDAESQERSTAAAADALASKMAGARTKFGLTDEGIEGMTSLMREKGIVDPMDAAELYVARQPKPKPSSRSTGRFGQAAYADVTGYADQAEMEQLLVSNPDKFLVTEVERFLAEEGIEG